MKTQSWSGSRMLPAAFALFASVALAQSNPTVVLETDPAVTYTGTWYQNYESPNYEGECYLTNAKGATAVISFAGTGITWYGVEDPYSGLAQVYLDGNPTTVDTYSGPTLYQHPIFTAQGLAPGDHTLSIEVLHQRDGETQGSWVWINYFKIYNGGSITGGTSATPGSIAPNSHSLVYTGNWYENKNSVHTTGTALLSMDANSSATITFTGSDIQWIAYQDPWSGIASVSIDGNPIKTVDTYSASQVDQTVAFDSGPLTEGTHTLTVNVTGTYDSQSGGAWIWLDSFVVK